MMAYSSTLLLYSLLLYSTYLLTYGIFSLIYTGFPGGSQ